MMESFSVPQSNFLQRTVLIVSAICQMLAVCIILTNISRYSEERLYVFVGILILSCIIMIIWIIAFAGAVNENYYLIYFVLVMWVLVALFWFFFLTGCITPTRCSESLWLIENKDRAMYQVKLETEYYYHEYHRPVFDTFPKKLNKETEFEHKEYEDIPYAVQYQPMVEFVKYYVPWSTPLGAIIYTISFSSVLAFFVWTSIVLKRYVDQLSKREFKNNRRMAVCDCHYENAMLKKDVGMA